MSSIREICSAPRREKVYLLRKLFPAPRGGEYSHIEVMGVLAGFF